MYCIQNLTHHVLYNYLAFKNLVQTEHVGVFCVEGVGDDA